MRTLIMVDIQNDFLPGGSLPVPGSGAIIPVINSILDKFDLIIATQDWHPSNHMSFASNHKGKKPFDEIELNGMKQVLWPDHCIQGSKGAEFPRHLNMNKTGAIIRKGMDPEIDSYSGFYDNGHKKNTGLAGYLRERHCDILYFCGLAADICVQYTIKDALKEGFTAKLISDATWPISQDDFAVIEQTLSESGVAMLISRNI